MNFLLSLGHVQHSTGLKCSGPGLTLWPSEDAAGLSLGVFRNDPRNVFPRGHHKSLLVWLGLIYPLSIVTRWMGPVDDQSRSFSETGGEWGGRRKGGHTHTIQKTATKEQKLMPNYLQQWLSIPVVNWILSFPGPRSQAPPLSLGSSAWCTCPQHPEYGRPPVCPPV